MKVFLIIVSILGALIAALGYRFRIHHWPFGKEMFIVGLSLFVFATVWLVVRKMLNNKSKGFSGK
jgi:hypothetical protein